MKQKIFVTVTSMGQKVKRGNYEKRKNGNEGEIILHDTKEV